ncbi:hypothetical protein HPTD01_3842 [Halomonas sp. TD01]|nr:hypothetical protein HPTD01_3842 [Halomonas sp. TD01]
MMKAISLLAHFTTWGMGRSPMKRSGNRPGTKAAAVCWPTVTR